MSVPGYEILGLFQFRNLREIVETPLSDEEIAERPPELRPRLLMYQEFVFRYLHPSYGIKRLLICAGVGVGKTLLSKFIAQARYDSGDARRTLVITKNPAAFENFVSAGCGKGKLPTMTRQEIRKRYINKQYIAFASDLESRFQEQVDEFDGALIIIDEAHNISVNEAHAKSDRPCSFDLYLKFVHAVPNATIIFMSATWMPDKPSKLLSSLSFLDSKGRNFHTTENIKRIDESPASEVVNVLKSIVPPEIGTRIIFYDGKEYMPTAVYQGCTEYEGIEFRTPVTITKFRGHQQKHWDDVVEKTISKNRVSDDYIFTTRSGISQFSPEFEDTSTAEEAIQKGTVVHTATRKKGGYKFNPKVLAQYKKATLGDYSCKMEYILEAIRESRGPVMINCDLVKKSAFQIAAALEANGYVPCAFVKDSDPKHGKDGLIVPDPPVFPLRYTLCTGNKSVSLSNPDATRIFTNPDNDDGSVIKVLIGSKVMNEGINIPNAHQLHIMSPHWNVPRDEQAVGRVVRASPDNAKMANREVKIFIHISVSSNPEHFRNRKDRAYDYSIDLHRQNVAKRKIDSVLQINAYLKSISINCYLHTPEKMDSAITFEKIDGRLTYFENHAESFIPNIFAYLESKYIGFPDIQHLEAAPILKYLYIDTEMLRTCIDLMRADVRFLFKDHASKICVPFLSDCGTFIGFTQDYEQHALHETRHGSDFRIVFEEPEIPTFPIEDLRKHVDKLTSMCVPCHDNQVLFAIMKYLVRIPIEKQIALFEYAFVESPFLRPILKRLYCTQVHFLEGKLIHTLRYSIGRVDESGSYPHSSTSITPRGISRVFVPELRRWVLLKDYLDFSVRFENTTIIPDREKKFQGVFGRNRKTLRVNIFDGKLRTMDDSNGQLDKRRINRGQDEASTSRSKNQIIVVEIINSSPLLLMILSDHCLAIGVTWEGAKITVEHPYIQSIKGKAFREVIASLAAITGCFIMS